MNPVDRVVQALEQRQLSVRGNDARGYIAQCPAHDDRQASLSVTAGDDERALLCCHAGCSTDDIVSALGLQLADLFPKERDDRAAVSRRQTREKPLPTEEQISKWSGDLLAHEAIVSRLFELRRWTPEAISGLGLGWDGERIVFPIRDANGSVAGVARYLPGERPNGEPKMKSVKGSTRQLWPAPETIKAHKLWLVEGEPDAVSMASIGLDAVAVPGVTNWRGEWAARFRGRDVVICADCDEQGRDLARRAADDLVDVASTVRVLDLDGSRSDGYDAGDLIREAAETGPDALAHVRELLSRMAADAVPVAPDWPAVSGRDLPSFPVDALPRRVAEWVDAIAEHTQTPADLPAIAALGVLSGAALGGAVVDCGAWEEELGLYLLPAMPSGDRKSTVLRAATKPLREIASERAAEAAPRVRELRSRVEVLEIRVRNLTKQIAKEGIDPAERLEAERDLAEFTAELDQIGQPVMPRMLADDATPEALGGLLARHRSIAVLAAESALIDNLVGRYSDGKANLHLVCAAYGGEPTTIDRRGQDPETLDRPLLAIALVIQPHVLEGLVAHPTARAQGLVARFAYALPETRLGRRKINAERVPPQVSDGWTHVVRRVADTTDTTDTTPPSEGPDMSSVGCVGLSPAARIVLDQGASGLLSNLQALIEPRLAPGQDLHSIADWAGRHHGRVARIAGLLHLCEHRPTEEISAATMRAAITIGDYFLAHGIAALGGLDEKTRSALRWLERRGESTVSLRDLHRGPFGAKGPVKQAEALAQSLAEMGALRSMPSTTDGPGRPRSHEYAVNPQILAGETPALVDRLPAHVAPNGHESVATPEEEALLERLVRAGGDNV